jgi:hypothetical protein
MAHNDERRTRPANDSGGKHFGLMGLSLGSLFGSFVDQEGYHVSATYVCSVSGPETPLLMAISKQ